MCGKENGNDHDVDKDNINDNVNRFFIFFFATKKKNFKSPPSNTFISELILSIMINLIFISFIQEIQ